MWFLYDSDGTKIGFTYNGQNYYYLKNAQGDITGIVDKNCNTIVEYNYDAWGKLLNMTDSSGDAQISQKNPFRYRGYYYDSETGLYYLNSRYYDPQTGRFLNADGNCGAVGNVQSHNMFEYGFNNPVNIVDYSGKFAITLTAVLGCVLTAFVASLVVYTVVSQPAVQQGIAHGIDSVGKAVSNTVNNIKQNISQKSKAKAQSKTIANTKPSNKNQAKFPLNPYDFKPKGLKIHTYVKPGTGKNGGVIKWELPGTGTAIFEWNEDYKYGEHYHPMLIEWDSHHDGTHYLPGTPVPEPWNSIYFGG